ncbi:MAG: AAA family ATPase [Paracoccaceae bacterium]
MTVQDKDIHSPVQDLLAVFAKDMISGDPLDLSVFEGTRVSQLGAGFNLRSDETAVLCLLAALSLSDAHNTRLPELTIGAALKMFPTLGWSDFAPTSVLRDWYLIHASPTNELHRSRLNIDSHILNWILSVPSVDHRLKPYVAQLPDTTVLPRFYNDFIARSCAHISSGPSASQCMIVGDGPMIRARAACDAISRLGMRPLPLEPGIMDLPAPDRTHLFRLIARETILSKSLPVIAFPDKNDLVLHRLQGLGVPAFILCDHAPRTPSASVHVLALPTLDATLRAHVWRDHLGVADAEQINALAETFHIGADEIVAICNSSDHSDPDQKLANIWSTARQNLRPSNNPLAHVATPKATWDDLILPPLTERTLKAFSGQVRHRAKVYRTWGFADRLHRGLGITALFAGPSGTGKTLAAEVIANDLQLDLLHVNISQVVDKYIGETEKHIGRMFDAAERSGAILFFDEADALFGQRSDGDSNQSRFASMTVAYLLQRIETSSAVCILATNLLGNIDDAFMRRMRYVIHFAFPAASERKHLWETVFPASAPVSALDFAKLAQLPAAGGTIRNASLNAAFLAADEDSDIGMLHVLHALELENSKLAQPLDLNPLRRSLSK